MPLSFMNDSVTVRRAPLVTRNGVQKRDWDNATEHTVANVQVTAASTSRDFDGRVLNVADGRTLRARYAADIQPGDRIVWDGAVYEVDGDVFHSKSPTGRVSSTRCSLVRWEG